MSTRLADLIEVRIGGLGDGERDALALLAFGEPLGIDVLEELGVAAAVAPLERRGIATVLGDGDDIEVRLTHPLYADVARGRTPVTEARTLQARLADVIARRGSTDALRLATWRVAAGLATDPAMLVTAADTANGMFEHETAERLGRLALAGGGRFDASIAVGEALIGQERFAEADALLAGVDLGELNDAEVVRVAECRHTALAGAAETDQAEAMLLDAHRHVSGPAWRDFLLAERAALLAVAGRLERALEAAPAVDDDALPPATRFRSLSALGIAWCMTGRPDLAVAAAEAAAPSVVALRDTLPRAPGWVASAWLLGLLHQGDLDGADRLMELVAEGLPGGFSDAWERLLTYRGVSCVLRGRPRTAARWLHESTVLHGPSDPGRRAALSGALLAQALALCGEVDEAAAWAERSRERQGHAEVWFAPTIDAAEAWVAAARNELTTSVELCERAAAAAAARGDVVMEAQALHDAVRFGAVRRPTARLGELASSCDGAWVRSFAAHAAALDAADGAALDEVSSSFASIGAALYAAEVAAEAATAHEQAGLRARASASSARSAALLAGCEGATTPILRAGSTRARLSRREREVALLAADGLSNKAIAERLSVSVRTVEGHLYQAFTKLGAATREELSDLL